jgi:hypothetical protein
MLPVIATPIYWSTILPLEGFEGKQSHYCFQRLLRHFVPRNDIKHPFHLAISPLLYYSIRCRGLFTIGGYLHKSGHTI